jgi:hypothetical protein
MAITIIRILFIATMVPFVLFTGTASGAEREDRPGIPNARGIYTGCYAISTGDSRLIPAWKGCRSSERRVTWNRRGQRGSTGPAGVQGETGPQGAQGPQGPQGLQGATGEQGATGATGATGPQGAQGIPGDPGLQGDPGPAGSQLIAGTPVTSAANAARNTIITATATCSAGTVVIGGGANVTTTATQKERAQLVSSYPSATDAWTAVGVVAIAALGTGNTMTVTAWVLCSL